MTVLKYIDVIQLGGEKMTKEYKNKVIWLHKSKAGEHLYAFGKEGDFHNVRSLLMNVSEVDNLLKGYVDSIKISIMENEENTETNSESR